MAVTGLDGWVDITATLIAPATSAGTNRKRIYEIAYGFSGGTAVLPTSLTIGGVTPTFEGGHALGSSVARSVTCQVSMNEAQIAAMVGSAIIITGGAFGRRVIATRSIQDTAQTASFNQGLFSSGATNITSGAVPSLTRVTGSFTVAAVHSILITNATMSNPSRVAQFASAGTQLSLGDATDTSRTIDASFTIASCQCAMDAVNYAPFPTAAITSINGSAFGAVKAGSAANTVVTTASFAPTSGTHGGTAMSAIAGSAGNYTFTSAAYVDGATFPEPDTAQTFTLTDGAVTPTASSVYSSPDGMNSVVLSSPELVDNTYITEAIPGVVSLDRIVFPTEGGAFSIAANGKITCAVAGVRVLWWWKQSTQVMTRLDVTINEAGEVVSVALHGRRLIGSRLVGRRMTARGL